MRPLMVPAPMTAPGFLAMRAELVERGLLDDEHRLTRAGHAHVDSLIAELAEAEAPPFPLRHPVRWRFNRKGWPHA